MQALVIANSSLPSLQRYEVILRAADVILCADGGANQAVKAGIRPHYVVGDFDSLTDETKKLLKQTEFVHRPSQYAPDLEKTLQFAIEKGVQAATILGVTRGRFDHQICNLNIMEKYSDKLMLDCIDDDGVGCFVHRHFAFEASPGQIVSIFSFRKANGICTKGLKYPLKDANMEWAVNDGLSNEVIASPVEITVQKGVLFVYRLWPDRS